LQARRTRTRRVLVHRRHTTFAHQHDKSVEQVPTDLARALMRDAIAHVLLVLCVHAHANLRSRKRDVPSCMRPAEIHMEDAVPPPPPDEDEDALLLDQVIELGTSEPELLLVLTKRSIGNLDEPEARTIIEAYMRSLGVPEEQLIDTSLCIAPCRNRPAIASLTCPTSDVTDAILPVAAGDRLDTTFCRAATSLRRGEADKRVTCIAGAAAARTAGGAR
jgi:hypothetical protein